VHGTGRHYLNAGAPRMLLGSYSKHNSEKPAAGYRSYLSRRCHHPLFCLIEGFAMRRARPSAAAKSH